MSRVKRPRLTETAVGAQVDELATLYGWEVERYEQRRASMIHEGLPDRRYVHRAKHLRVWVELKRPGGKLTHGQHKWLTAELDAGSLATVIDAVEQWRVICTLLQKVSDRSLQDVHDHCRAFVDLCWLRGPRDVRPAQPTPRAGRGLRRAR